MVLLDIVLDKVAPEVGDMAEGGPEEEQVSVIEEAARDDKSTQLGRKAGYRGWRYSRHCA